MKTRILFASIALLAVADIAWSADDVRGDHPGSLPNTPEQEKALFHLPPGFEIQLVAAEPEIQKPINIAFDGAGRLWVTGSEQYPWPSSIQANGEPISGFADAYTALANAFHAGDKAPPISKEARDTVRILSDFDSHGHAGKVSVFADGLNIPSGVQPLPRAPGAKGDTAIVYSIPNIWRLEDTTGSGHADKREVLYGRAGFLDTHGGMSSFLYWMDGWIYGAHGFRNHSEIHDQAGRVTVLDSGNTYRFRPDGSAFEIYAHGQTNPFGLSVDPLGNFYTADSHSRPVYLLLHGAWYEGIKKSMMAWGSRRTSRKMATARRPSRGSPTTPTTNGPRNIAAIPSSGMSSRRKSIATGWTGTARRPRRCACRIFSPPMIRGSVPCR